jgi:hypothetical protein
MEKLFNLQLFAEGGGAPAGGEAGGTVTTGVEGGSPEPQGEDLSKVIYGKSVEDVANPQGDTTKPPEDKTKTFENLIKKGGEYEKEFSKRTQDIINKRFKETKQLQEQLNSRTPIMETLARKYGLKADDAEGILKALDSDTAMYEKAAFDEGLTVEQYREREQLRRENAQLKAAEDELKQREQSQRIYAQWEQESNDFAQKYGIKDFDLATEAQNPEFTRLLANGISIEAAYKAIHFDDMMNGAMAQTADSVSKALASRVATRANRVSENGVDSQNNNSIFKSDVNKLTDADLAEICRRVKNGDKVSF